MTVIAFSEDGTYFGYSTTNADGTYLMATNLETGTYNVTVGKIGFKVQEVVINVANGETTNLKIVLEKN